MKKTILFLVALSAFVAAHAQVDILAARLAPLNSTVTVRGIVTNGSELGTIRYIQDSTAGISLYDVSLAGVNRGDSIVATGTLTDYNNLLEIQPVSSFTVITTANPGPTPIVITPNQVNESVEGELVQINNVTFAQPGTMIAGNTSYAFTSSSQSGTIYVKTGSPLVGTLIPSGSVTLVGIASQFLTTYQVLPRDPADLISNSSITITTPVVQSNITSSGFDLTWNTNISGSTYVLYGRTPSFELGTVSGAAGLTHSVTISGANPADIFYVKAFSVNAPDTAYSAVRSYATVSNSSGNIKVYFDKSVDTTLSTGTNATLLFHTLDDTIIGYINRAQHTLDIAIYSFDNANISNITTAINNAYSRGVKVRIISDGGNTNPALSTLNAAIPRIVSPTTSAYTIMHNKFMIIDANSANPLEPILWTGSTNWTDNQTGTDANNVIIFQDQSIAKGYKMEFDEMWGDTGMVPNSSASRFGQFKTNNTPHEYLINGKRVESYFSPSDGTNAKILEKIGTANTDLCIETMQITRSDLAYGITNANNSGVSTYVLVDDSTSTTVWPILSSGLPAGHLIDYSATGIMHQKYMIVDPSNIASDPMVLTGSHNWSTSADTKNDENTVVVHDAAIANIYYQEFVPRFTQNGGVMGIHESAANTISMNVFPNPSSGSFTVQYELDQSVPIQFTITDITGKTVMTNSFSGIEGENTRVVNTSGLAPGMYFLAVNNGTNTGFVRIVIQ